MKKLLFIYIFFVTSIYGFMPVNFWSSMQWKRSTTPEDFRFDESICMAEKNYQSFCRQFEKGSKDTLFCIPKILHFIWLGSSIPLNCKTCIDSWIQLHPDWQVKIWTDIDCQNFNWSYAHSKKVFEEGVTFAEKSDILRLEILYQFGGIYSDTDVLCLQAFDRLVESSITFFSSFELNYSSPHYGKSFYIGTAVLGASKGSRLIKECLMRAKTAKESPNENLIKRTGPGLVSVVCEQYLKEANEKILILPCSFIYPLPWKKRNESYDTFIASETLAIHLWDNSWMK
jgi:mannosyltransferase OCH1-like enzyme